MYPFLEFQDVVIAILLYRHFFAYYLFSMDAS